MKWNRLDTSEVTTSGDVLQSEGDRFLLIKNHNQYGSNYQLLDLTGVTFVDSKCTNNLDKEE